MPYASKAQQSFHANKPQLEKQGVNVSEWDAASRGKKLPPRAPMPKPQAKRKSLYTGNEDQ